MTRLVIVRHGNTFGPGEVPTRVGGRTDIPLVESGIAQACTLGIHFKEQGVMPNRVFTSNLQRTKQTAEFILSELACDAEVSASAMFNEVDYGPDENKVEEEVIARIGEDAIQKWDKEAIVPDGWAFDPDQAVSDWLQFGAEIMSQYPDQTVMVVTSNGIARFAPHLTGDYEGFKASHNIKLKTGSYGILDFDGTSWKAAVWGIRP